MTLWWWCVFTGSIVLTKENTKVLLALHGTLICVLLFLIHCMLVWCKHVFFYVLYALSGRLLDTNFIFNMITHSFYLKEIVLHILFFTLQKTYLNSWILPLLSISSFNTEKHTIHLFGAMPEFSCVLYVTYSMSYSRDTSLIGLAW